MATTVLNSLSTPDEHNSSSGMRRAPTLPAATSCVLDVVRFCAALLVVLAHFSHAEFFTGIATTQILGDIAVPIFFVLSGFVIRYVTLSREHTLRIFLIDRASRIYSVAIPALLLTLFVTSVAARVAPAYFALYFADISNHPLIRILLNITLLSQSWGHNAVAFCDSPFWSLSYEGLFYIAYGLFFYLRGAKRIFALLGWAALAGPQVAFLLPVWWLGCWLYDLFQIIRLTRIATALQVLGGAYLVAGSALYFFGLDMLLVGPLRAILAFSQLRNPLLLFHQDPFRATLMAVATGTFAAVVLLVLLLASDLLTISRANPWILRFRHIADGTFAIYLMHYPLMVLAACVGLYHPGVLTRNLGVTAAICILLILAANPLDALKELIRKILRTSFPPTFPFPGPNH